MNLRRWWAIVIKEFLQLKRDRLTFAMMVGIPIIQLMLFGFAINTDPKHLPIAVVAYDESEFTRSTISALQNSEYFLIRSVVDPQEALRKGEILFILTIPADFTHTLLRGERPSLWLDADATDPLTTSVALLLVDGIIRTVMQRDFKGALAPLSLEKRPFEIHIHRLYNPNGITQYNIIPGLMGVILTMTLTMMTALSITREREKGTLENLLSTPTRPIEIMLGKIIPYVMIGLIQTTIILLAAIFIFHIPIRGSLGLIYLMALLFIVVNLTVGITISSIASNMLQALQLSVFYFLPSILLSGFMFPYLGMPTWAQYLGGILPLTYFNRLSRGIILKDNDFALLWPNIWPLLLITLVMMTLAIRSYKQTLD